MNHTVVTLKTQPDGTKLVRLGKKTAGVIKGTRFSKRVRGSSHMLRTVPGWAIDVDVLAALDDEGVEILAIEDIETGIIYETTLVCMRDNGLPVHFYKHGRQICLHLSFWNIK
jgi:hypothetical protein